MLATRAEAAQAQGPAGGSKASLRRPRGLGLRPGFAFMNERPKTQRKAAQRQRLSAALRENLKRRKAQAKGRAAAVELGAEPHDSAGIGPDKRKS
jgi:hypothetical protein